MPGLACTDGVYPGWCVQDHVATDLNNQAATLYSTIGGSLPADVAALPWNKINWVLNHKIRGAGKSDLAFFKDVQTAIWLLLGEPNPDFGVSVQAQQMVADANAHPTFVPGPADVVAVIIYSDGMGTAAGSIQESIIELKPMQSITNNATGTGKIGTTPISSNQAQFTVNQIIQTTPTPSGAPGQSPAVDKTVYSDGAGTRTTQPFNTSSAGEVLIALVASDGPSSGGQQITVSGAGLTWTLVKRANSQLGTSEIWKAFATAVLTNVSVSATQKFGGGYHQALTVVSFTGATGVGASKGASAASGAPTASLTTTKANSFVYGVGNDWDHANGRVLGPNQLMVHQWIDNQTGDTSWVQARAAGVPAAATVVQLNDTAPTTDRWNFAIVEIVK